MTTFTATKVWIDSLRPTVDETGTLTEMTALVNIEFRDNGDRFVKNVAVETMGMIDAATLATVQGMYQTLIDNLKAQYGIA